MTAAGHGTADRAELDAAVRQSVESLARMAATGDPAGRAAILLAVLRAVAETTDDGSGMWTAERLGIARIIDAANAHHRNMIEVENDEAARPRAAGQETTS